MIPPYYTQRTIARVESTGNSVVGSNLVYTFRSHPYFTSPYNGIVIVKLTAPPSGTTTQPVIFTSTNGGDIALYAAGGTQATAADMSSGIHLVYYESTSNTLQLIV